MCGQISPCSAGPHCLLAIAIPGAMAAHYAGGGGTHITIHHSTESFRNHRSVTENRCLACALFARPFHIVALCTPLASIFKYTPLLLLHKVYKNCLMVHDQHGRCASFPMVSTWWFLGTCTGRSFTLMRSAQLHDFGFCTLRVVNFLLLCTTFFCLMPRPIKLHKPS